MPICTRTGPQIGSLTRKKRRQAQAPSQQPPHAPTPIRRLPPIDRWAPQAAHSTSRPGQSAYANPPLPAPLPEPPQPNRRDISRASHRLQSRRLSVSLRAPLQRRLLSRPNRCFPLLLLADLDDRVIPTPIPPWLRRLRRRLHHLRLSHHRAQCHPPCPIRTRFDGPRANAPR